MSSERKTTSRGETSQLRRVESIARETDRLPLPRHLYPLALLHLHLQEGPSCSLPGVTGASVEDCFAVLGEGGVSRKQGIQQF